MSDYKALKGIAVKSISGDPTSLQGQVWYDSAANAFQLYKSVGAWTTGGTTNFNATTAMSAGTQTAGLLAGGYNAVPGDAVTIDNCDEYNGVDWTAGGTMASAKQGPSGAGTQTAAFSAGGKTGAYGSTEVANDHEEYNGVDWTEAGNINTARYFGGAAGTQTAGIFMSGHDITPTKKDESEEYNGSAWSEGEDLNTARINQDYGAGTQTAALLAGGQPPGGTPAGVINEEYDGTSWTETGDLNNFRYQAPQFGTQTSSLVCMGGPFSAYKNIVEEWNGVSWATAATLSIGKTQGSALGASTAAGLATTGNISGSNYGTQTTEEWTGAVAATELTST